MIDDIGSCFICGVHISIAEAGRDEEIVYDEYGNPIHKICALSAIRELEKRTETMKEPGPMIEITEDSLEPELEKILFKIIQRAQIRASQEGFRELMDYDIFENYNVENKIDFQDFVLSWAYDYGPDECYLCGRFFACRPQYWAFDANGNIVHEICYRGKT